MERSSPGWLVRRIVEGMPEAVIFADQQGAISIALLKDEHGEVTGAVAVVRDVTARWQAERELRRRLAALEAQLGSDSNATAT